MKEYRPSKQSVNVLGTDYNIYLKTNKEDISLEQYSGYCDKFDKKIVIRYFSEEEMEHANDFTDNIIGMLNDTLIHELTHAFLYESGFNWTDISEEDICYWMSSNLKKINRTFNEIKIKEITDEKI